VVDALPPAGRRAAKDLFLRLVIATDLTEPVRQRIPRATLAADPATEAVLDALVRTRLVIADADTVEVAHEAVCRAWPRLRDWLEQDREGIRVRQHLRRAAQDWDQSGHEPSELYRGARLAAAVEWAAGDVELNPTERAFLDAGATLRNTEERVAHDQLRRQQRTNRRLRTALAGVGVLLVLALVAGLIAWRQRSRADTQADLARSEAERADTQAGIAQTEADRADEEATVARSRELAAAAVSVLADDPTLSKLLAVTAASFGEPTTESIAALHQAWAADPVVNRLPPPPQPLNGTYASIDPSGSHAVIGGGGDLTASWNHLEVVDPRTGDLEWTFDPPYFSANPVRPLFSPDGSAVVTGVVWVQKPWERPEPDPQSVGAFFLDAGTGEIVQHVDVGRCGGIVSAMSATELLVKTLRGRSEQTCDWLAGPIAVELIDLANGQRRVLTADGTAGWDGTALSADGRYVAFDDLATGRAEVMDVSSGRTVLSFESDDRFVRALNGKGSLLAYGDPIEVWDVASGKMVAKYPGHEGATYFATFDNTGAGVYSTGEDGNLHHWDARTGQPIAVLPKIGQLNVSAAAGGIMLVNASNSTTNVVDTRVRGEVGAIETCPGSVLRDSLEVAAGIVVVGMDCDGDNDATTYVADVETGEVLYTLTGQGGRALSISPDGTRFVRQEAHGAMVGTLTIRDLATGETIVKLDGLCGFDAGSTRSPDEAEGCRPYPQSPFALMSERLRWSPDGKMLASGSPGGAIVWDTATGDMLHAEVAPPTALWFRAAQDNYAFDTIFSPDSSRLIVSGNFEVRSLRTDTWELESQTVNNAIGGYTLGFFGYSADGSSLLAEGRAGGDPGGTLQWLDPESLESEREVWPTHEAGVESRAVSPHSSLVATGAADGLVRLWDARTGVLVHEIPFGGARVAGVDFVDETHLAVALDGGNVLLVTIDPAELLDIVRRSLARGFTEAECDRFGFGDDCPTLVQLRGQRPDADDPSVINGTYRLGWTIDELVTATIDAYPEENVTRELAETIWSGTYGMQKPGRHTLRLADGRFDHTVTSDDGALTTCTGSYRVVDARVEFVSERGGCEPRRVFNAAFEVSDDELRFTDYIGDPTEYVLFSSKPWQRSD
jgi:WD40 repeat protein